MLHSQLRDHDRLDIRMQPPALTLRASIV